MITYITHNSVLTVIFHRGGMLSSYITAFDSFRRWFFYIGVQMALPFRKDKKSGVKKDNQNNIVCNTYPVTYDLQVEKLSDSSKSVVNRFKTTALQLGARG